MWEGESDGPSAPRASPPRLCVWGFRNETPAKQTPFPVTCTDSFRRAHHERSLGGRAVRVVKAARALRGHSGKSPREPSGGPRTPQLCPRPRGAPSPRESLLARREDRSEDKPRRCSPKPPPPALCALWTACSASMQTEHVQTFESSKSQKDKELFKCFLKHFQFLNFQCRPTLFPAITVAELRNHR